ncbi:hypothetical protein BJ742DRAFT_154385 [Cladochytrium replicatum]|nr:hypothetical protein BJ742DRAFT_154385 [Cladochytrium replicatum]
MGNARKTTVKTLGSFFGGSKSKDHSNAKANESGRASVASTTSRKSPKISVTADKSSRSVAEPLEQQPTSTRPTTLHRRRSQVKEELKREQNERLAAEMREQSQLAMQEKHDSITRWIESVREAISDVPEVIVDGPINDEEDVSLRVASDVQTYSSNKPSFLVASHQSTSAMSSKSKKVGELQVSDDSFGASGPDGGGGKSAVSGFLPDSEKSNSLMPEQDSFAAPSTVGYAGDTDGSSSSRDSMSTHEAEGEEERGSSQLKKVINGDPETHTVDMSTDFSFPGKEVVDTPSTTKARASKRNSVPTLLVSPPEERPLITVVEDAQGRRMGPSKGHRGAPQSKSDDDVDDDDVDDVDDDSHKILDSGSYKDSDSSLQPPSSGESNRRRKESKLATKSIAKIAFSPPPKQSSLEEITHPFSQSPDLPAKTRRQSAPMIQLKDSPRGTIARRTSVPAIQEEGAARAKRNSIAVTQQRQRVSEASSFNGPQNAYESALRLLMQICAITDSLQISNSTPELMKGASAFKKVERAVELLRHAGAGGHAAALCKLGSLYAGGLPEFLSADMQQAVILYQRASELGSTKASLLLADLYLNTDESNGIMRDIQQATEHYRRAAEAGHPRAQANLGAIYLGGRGIPSEPVEAETWLLKAAEKGIQSAQFNLGVLYENGRVSDDGLTKVEQNQLRSLRWYVNAAEGGDEDAKVRLQPILSLIGGQDDTKETVTKRRKSFSWVRKNVSR